MIMIITDVVTIRNCLRLWEICLFVRKFKVFCNDKVLANLLTKFLVSGLTSKLSLQTERIILQLQGYDFEIECVK